MVDKKQKVDSLSYEGHYSLTFMYHIWLLLHFKSGNIINFPYFLLRSLKKMSEGVHRGKASQVTCKLYHHGLIAILVKKELEVKNMTWEVFLNEL